jgi:hypothetical protein
MALQRVWHRSPHQSSRGGSGVRLIVLHSTEGAQTYQSLGNWFANPSARVSSHVGIDNTSGNKIGEYVKPSEKAWTAGNANGVAIQAELCTPSGASANWSADKWKAHPHMLRKAAEWIAEEARRYGIPITKLDNNSSRSGRGVCQHSNLGWAGNDHFDCGRGFPMDYVLSMARGGSPTAPPSQPKPPPIPYELYEVSPMQLVFDSGGEGRAPAALLVIPNFFADGKARYTFGCAEATVLRVDMMGYGKTETLSLHGGAGRQGVGIPKGCKAITVRRDSGRALIDSALSK